MTDDFFVEFNGKDVDIRKAVGLLEGSYEVNVIKDCWDIKERNPEMNPMDKKKFRRTFIARLARKARPRNTHEMPDWLKEQTKGIPRGQTFTILPPEKEGGKPEVAVGIPDFQEQTPPTPPEVRVLKEGEGG